MSLFPSPLKSAMARARAPDPVGMRVFLAKGPVCENAAEEKSKKRLSRRMTYDHTQKRRKRSLFRRITAGETNYLVMPCGSMMNFFAAPLSKSL